MSLSAPLYSVIPSIVRQGCVSFHMSANTKLMQRDWKAVQSFRMFRIKRVYRESTDHPSTAAGVECDGKPIGVVS